MSYIELHARSAFSFLEGASLPEELAAVCSHLNLPAMALLDVDGVYGAPRFHMAAQKTKIRSHIGAEVTCSFLYPVIGSRPTVILSEAGASRSEAPVQSKNPYPRQTAAETQTLRFARNDKSAGNESTFRLPLLVSTA